MKTRKFALIGKKLSHSFSSEYFKNKFLNEHIPDAKYDTIEIQDIDEINEILASDFTGFNVTIPYKTAIIPYLDGLDDVALYANAVNVVKIVNGIAIGYNTDVYGFHRSLSEFLGNISINQALILGTGGASNAAQYVLNSMNIDFQLVSRNKPDCVLYSELTEKIVRNSKLIINTTPVGTFPDIDVRPEIPYKALTKEHFLFDMIYNPKITLFLKSGMIANCNIKNGYDMLIYQAEKSWEIWNQ
ncbi:MAG: shikimate dehydrogenase [Saprospiraceae bacterium]